MYDDYDYYWESMFLHLFCIILLQSLTYDYPPSLSSDTCFSPQKAMVLAKESCRDACLIQAVSQALDDDGGWSMQRLYWFVFTCFMASSVGDGSHDIETTSPLEPEPRSSLSMTYIQKSRSPYMKNAKWNKSEIDWKIALFSCNSLTTTI